MHICFANMPEVALHHSVDKPRPGTQDVHGLPESAAPSRLAARASVPLNGPGCCCVSKLLCPGLPLSGLHMQEALLEGALPRQIAEGRSCEGQQAPALPRGSPQGLWSS